MPRAEAMIEAAHIEPYEEAIHKGLAALSKEKVIPRIWKKDWTVWKKDPKEIQNRLGWLTSPAQMAKNLSAIRPFVLDVRQKGYTRALLLGMGGSSLAPLVLTTVFKTRAGYVDLEILDLTAPAAVLAFRNKLNPKTTLFIVSSKSGTTVETNSFFKFFWNWTADRLGQDKTGDHFAAITDPGTSLEDLALELRFGAVFRGDPEIGGRFSALSPFCLVPAALKGIGIDELLDSGRRMAALCRVESDLRANPGALLGAILGVMAAAGRDKLTFLLSPRLRSFGLWLEQLIAESTGKEGRGILPVEGEDIGPAAAYGDDRLFIRINEKGSGTTRAPATRISKAGFPMFSMMVPGLHDLGGQFFLWEFATAVAGFFLGNNPFDQPDVDSAKKRTQEFLKIYCERGVLPEETPAFRDGDILLFSDIKAPSFRGCLEGFLSQAKPGDYAAVQAFVAPSTRTDAALGALRNRLWARTRLATTMGYGPRFLHSTGQLHKGDRGNGLFIQITAEDETDAAIPDDPGSATSAISFGVLKAAQARGDFAALKSAGRRIIRFHLGSDVAAGLRQVIRRLA